MASSSTPTPTHLACTLCKVIQQSLDDFDYENALYVAEWMMIQVPQFEEANYFLAKCLYLLHRPKLAIPLLSHLQPSQHRFSRYLLARIYLDLDLFFEAEQALLQTPLESGVLPNLFQDPKHQESLGIVPSPEDAVIWKLLGSIYRKTHRTDLAMTCFDQALKCNPWLWTAYESLCQLGSTTHPETYFHHVPSLSSTTLVSPRPPPTKRQKRSASPVPSPSSSFLSSYAHVTSLLHQSKYGEAHQALTKLPTDTFTLLYSALLLFEQRKYPSSQVMFETLYRHSPWCLHGIDVYSTCLWFLQWEGKLAQLAHHLKSVAPLANETWVVVGNYASVKRFHPHAITCFQRAIQLTKNAHYAFTLLGHEYLTVKEIDNAIHAFRQAIHFHPRSYNAWHGLGTCYQETDQLDLALYHYQKAAELHPCSVLISYIGNVYHAKGNELRAIEMYDQAIQLDSDNPVPQFAKATALVRLNRCEESLPILLDLRRLRPMELNVLCLLGWVYFQLGKKNEALRSFLEAYATCHADKVPVFLRELVSEVQALEPTGEWEDLDHLLHAIGISEGTKLRF